MPFALRLRPWLKWGAYYTVTGAFIAILAAVNGYPLVYSDSGTYIHNAFTFEQLEDRPIGYGLIINAVTWKSTLWTVVLFQGAVCSWLLMQVVRGSVRAMDQRRKVHALLLAVLVTGTSLPWYAAQIMADVFTPMVGLVLWLLYRGEHAPLWRRVLLWLMLFFFSATHNSHFPIVAGLQGILLLARGLPDKWSLVPRQGWWPRWWGINGVLLASATMIALFNYVPHGQFRLSRASNTFLAGRLCESGIMRDYLIETCPENPHPLCAYKDRLPADALNGFLWSEKGFVRAEELSLAEADSVLAPLVSDLLARPEFMARYAWSMVELTCRQLLEWDAGAGLHAYGTGTSPQAHHWWRLPHEKSMYDNALQQRGFWADLSGWNRWLDVVLLMSWAVPLLGLLVLRRHPDLRRMLVWAVALWFINAAVTSSLSIVDGRMQARVVWLVPMVAVLMVHAWWSQRRQASNAA